MPIELIKEIKHDDDPYPLVESDLIIYSVRVENPWNKSFDFVSFRSPSNVRIQEVIESIEHELLLPRLWMDGKPLNSNSTLASCGVTTGATITLLEEEDDPTYSFNLTLIEVRANKKYKSHQISLQADERTSVSNVLERLAADKDLKFASRGHLVWKGVSLRPPTASLITLGIRNNEVLQFNPRSIKFRMQVPVTNESRALEVETDLHGFHSQRLLEAKLVFRSSSLQNAAGGTKSHYQLFHNGSRLLEACLLGEFDIQTCSILHLQVVSDATVLLRLKTENGSIFDSKVNPYSTSVREIKETISRKKDFPVSHQLLRFDEAGRETLLKELLHSSRYSMEYKQPDVFVETAFQDDLPLSAYNVVSGASIEILLRRYPLVITDVNGEVFELLVKASESILDVKRKLYALLQIPIEHQTLKLDGDIPEDSSILCEIQLLEGGKLSLSYGSFEIDDRPSIVAITVNPIFRTHSDLRAVPNLHGPSDSFILRASKDSSTETLFDRVALLENIDMGELRLILAGARIGIRGRLSDAGIQEDDEVDAFISQYG